MIRFRSVTIPGTALVLLSLTGCGSRDDTEPRVLLIDDFTPGDAPATCEAIHPGFEAPSDVEDLRSLGDSSLLIQFGAARVVVEADAQLQPLHRYEYAREGPGAVRDPRGILGFSDSVVVADAVAARLVTLRRDGTSSRRDIGFPPDRLVMTDAGIVVTELSTPFSSQLARLVTGDEVRPLPILKDPFDGAEMAAIGNMTAPLSVEGGRSVYLFHQFIAPQAHRGVMSRGTLEWETLPIPIPAATGARAWWYPEAPYAAEEMESLIAPAIAVAGREDGSEIYILGRSGRRRGTHMEKAIYALDRDLGFRRGWTLDFNATQMAYLDREQALILTTPLDEWYRCDVT